MSDRLLFESRGDLRKWLGENGRTSGGVWLVFGKQGGPQTLTYEESLEEALSFGWIDSLIKSVDDKTYLRYFAPRRPDSKWSETNKALVQTLQERGLMTDAGREAVRIVKEKGKWDAPPPVKISDEQVPILTAALAGREPAYSNFLAMPPSVKRTYTAHYLSAKSEKTKASRLEWIVDRLNKNLKPM